MPIKLNGETTGSVTLTAPATGSDVTVTIPSSSNTTMATSDSAFMIGGTLSPSNRNILTNGSFSVWQRGTSTSSSGGSVYVDCWREYSDTAVGVQSRDTSISAGGTRQSYKFTANASTATNISLFQIIETANCFHTIGQQVTFSVYLRSNVTQTMVLSINYNASEDASWTTAGWTGITSSSFSVSSTITRYSITGTVPSNARTLQVSIGSSPTLAAASFVNIAAAQLELGSTPTQFEFEDYGTTLRKCQRYYQPANILSTAANTGEMSGVSFAVPMRAMISSPVTLYAQPGGSGTANQLTRIGVGAVSVSTATFSGSTTSGVGSLYLTTLVAGAIYYGSFWASAEL